MATYGEPIEDVSLYDADDEAMEAYGQYLADHDAYMANGGILYADDFETWLRHNLTGRFHRDRIDAES